MGSSPKTHLFYGYAWDSETSISSILRSDEDHDWVTVLLKRRGYSDPWDTYPDRESLIAMGRNATPDQYALAISDDRIFVGARGRDDYVNERVGGYIFRQNPEFDAALNAWRDAKNAAQEEFSCDISSYGAFEYGGTTAYIYVTDSDGEKRSYRSSWDEPTALDLAALASLYSLAWDASLQHFIGALDLPMEGDDYSNPPVGPGWFMVSSYG